MSRYFLVSIFLVFVTAATGLAQGSKGRTGSGTTPKSTLAPSSAPTVSKNSPAANARSSNPPSQNRHNNPTSFGNTSPKNQTQERSSRPSSPQTGYRTATYAPPSLSQQSYTEKGGAKNNNNSASPLKPAERGAVNWLTLEQALEKSKTEKRKIFVDMYTNWCGWCKHLDSTTFVNPIVAKYLNEHYYPVKFNAEQESDIVFKDKTYKFKKNGARGYHELAAFWLNNRLSFPTIVFLDENQQLIQPVPGYQDATKMNAIINYFGTDSHKKTPWETYEKNFPANKN